VSTGLTSRFVGNNSNYSFLKFKDILTNGGITPEYNTIQQKRMKV